MLYISCWPEGENGGRPSYVACGDPLRSSIPAHVSITLLSRPWAIDKRRRAFLWTGGDEIPGRKCGVALWTVRRPRELGDLDPQAQPLRA
jgi:hypothetical protein